MGKEQELILAAQNGNLAQIDKILGQRTKSSGLLQSIRRSVGPNCQDSNGYTPLHHAALNGKRDAVEMLLKYEASTNIPDFAGSYPLHLAAWNGHAEVVELLLNRGPSRANVNEQNNNNETALHLACQYGHNEVVVVLLECHADPHIRNLKNESALDLASQYGRLDAVNYLLTYFPDLIKKTISSHSPIHLASRNGHYDIVKALLDRGMSANLVCDEGTPLHIAALYGKSNIVKLVLQTGVDINIRDKNGLTVMDLLSANPSQRSREITAWIYTHIQNEEESFNFGGKSRTVSEACNSRQKGYDEIPPPRPISEFAISSPNVHRSTQYDEVPPPLCAYRASLKDNMRSTSEVAVTDVYDAVPSPASSGRQVKVIRQSSYDEVPTPRAISVPSRTASSPPSYDYVPPPRHASGAVNNNGEVVTRPQSLNVGHSERDDVAVGRGKHVESAYGVVKLKPNQSATLPTRSHSTNGEINRPVADVEKPPRRAQAPSKPLRTFSSRSLYHQNNRSSSSQPTRDTKDVEDPEAYTRKQTNYPNQPDSSYEFVELPRVDSPSRNNQSTPISIPSQHRSLPRVGSYDTVLSPPRRFEPIGASESPYGNVDIIKRLEDRKEGDGLPWGVLETRSDPEGAKRREEKSPSTRRDVCDYQNIIIPPRARSLSSKTEVVYENMPASPVVYEHNVPRSQPRPAFVASHSGKVDERSPTSDEKTSRASSMSDSPSSERRATDYENFELPCRSPAWGGSPSSLKSRNAYEILPPHILHAPIEPGCPKPDAQGRVRPPVPKPYREARKMQQHKTNSGEDDYCTLREALSAVTSPTDDASPYPSFSPPSPSTARDVLLHALDSQTERNAGGRDDVTSRRSSECSDGFRSRSRTLKYENVMFDRPTSSSKCSKDSGTHESKLTENFRLSSVSDGPMNEYEEWKKIERFMNILGEEIGEERKEAEHMTSDVGKWLNGFQLGLYESYLLANGFDDVEFLAGGILEEQDLLQMGVLDPVYRKKILDNVALLALPPRVGVNGFEPDTVEEWLNALRLEEYLDLFHHKGYNTMDRIKQMWELELESNLAIHTLGHRKRILASLPQVKRRSSMVVSAEDIKDRLAEIDVFGGEFRLTSETDNLDERKPSWSRQQSSNDKNSSVDRLEPISLRREQPIPSDRNHDHIEDEQKQKELQQRQQMHEREHIEQQQHLQWQEQLKQQQEMEKQRSSQQHSPSNTSNAPEVPQNSNVNVERNKSGGGVQVNGQRKGSLSPHWNHPPEALLRGNVNYTTKYLGSHFIKDMIGESSTIEACRKMRMSTQKLQKIPAVILSISVTGVRFIDARSRIVISSHYIHNISYCTQDLEDCSVLAYIAKDQKANAHYCHVFKANSPAVSDEIVMTLGQAFELAYEQYSHAQYTSGNS